MKVGTTMESILDPTNPVKHLSKWTVLPVELLLLVFSQLPGRDLRAVVLVCRLWREVGELPRLWAWVHLPWRTREEPEVLGWRRLQAARQLQLGGRLAVTEELLQAVVKHPGLSKLSLGQTNLTSLEPGLLARAVARLQELQLSYTCITSQQAEDVFTTLSESSPLSRLHIVATGLTTVSPRLLATALARIKDVRLWHTNLSRQQATAIFSAVSVDARLKTLSLGYNSALASVEPGLLARKVNMLEEVELEPESCLTRLQVERLLRQSLVKTSLRRLEMGGGKAGLDQELVEMAKQTIPVLYV